VNLNDPRCTVSDTDCNDAGFDPGRVPPQVEDFVGELKCIEVDSSGAPLAGNHLKGEATIVAVDRCDNPTEEPDSGTCASDGSICTENADCPGTTGDVAKYNALGVEGLETLNDDPVLCLGGEPTTECPLGAEYNACPETWIVNHLVDSALGTCAGDTDVTCQVEEDCELKGTTGPCNGVVIAEDPVLANLGEDSRSDTSITIIPCTQDFESQFPTTVVIQFLAYDEFESVFSASTSITCWAELGLDEISNIFLPPAAGPLQETFVQTRLRPSNNTASGFMVVANTRVTLLDGDEPITFASAAANVHVEGERRGPDLITIPADQLTPVGPDH
jgi:hypothetical protein